MKRCLQLVALCLVTLLAVPPALADELCRLSEGWQQMNDGACCADSGDGSIAHAAQNTASTTPVALAQSCNEGCCSVSPQDTPLPGAPEKNTTDQASLAQCGITIAAFVPVPASALGCNPVSGASPPDRQVLLQTFRI